MTYSEKIPVVVGSKIIDGAMRVVTKGELAKATMTWKQAHFRAVMSGSLQLPCTGSNGPVVEKEVISSSLRVDTVEVKEFCWDDIWGTIHTTLRVTIPPFGTVSVHGNTSVMGHCMWVHIFTEATPGPQLLAAVVLAVTYGELHLGSSQVLICLCNLSAHSIKIPKKIVVGQVVPANQVLAEVLPTGTLGESTSNPQKDRSWRPWTSKA